MSDRPAETAPGVFHVPAGWKLVPDMATDAMQDAARGYVDDVIKPSETRPRLIRALEVMADKRDTNPPRKHGNIPL